MNLLFIVPAVFIAVILVLYLIFFDRLVTCPNCQKRSMTKSEIGGTVTISKYKRECKECGHIDYCVEI